MAGYLVPPTKNPGDVLTSALWNSYIRDNLDFGMVRPIQDVLVVGSPAASVDFVSIPATFAHLRLVCYLRGDTAAGAISALLRFNGVSTASYQWQRLWGAATTAFASEGLAATAIDVGNCPANTAGANMFGATIIDIPHYANAANYKSAETVTGYRQGASSGAALSMRTSGWMDSGNAINRVTLLPAAGNFIVGSRVTLYGMGGI